jgi:hypothetical protein
MAKPVKLDSGSYRIVSFTYDSTTGILNIVLEYYQNMNNQQVHFTFDFPPYVPFNNMPTVNIPSNSLISNNNLYMEVYSDEQYKMAIII